MGTSIHADDLSARTARDFPAITSRCHADMGDPARLPPADCGTGDVVLWGDSHAYAWRPYAERFGAITPLTRGACPPSAGRTGFPLCAQFNRLAVERAKQGRIVIMAAAWLRWLNDEHAQATRDGFADALAAVAPHVQKVIVLGPLPRMPYNARKCIDKGRIDACVVSRAAFDQKAAAGRAFLQAQAARYANVEYIDPAGFFCNATACPMMKDGYSLYWDDNHISASAARNFR
jgi:hypothetical protein